MCEIDVWLNRRYYLLLLEAALARLPSDFSCNIIPSWLMVELKILCKLTQTLLLLSPTPSVYKCDTSPSHELIEKKFKYSINQTAETRTRKSHTLLKLRAWKTSMYTCWCVLCHFLCFLALSLILFFFKCYFLPFHHISAIHLQILFHHFQ